MSGTRVAMYLRLSSADEDTGFRKIESESIGNQRMYINNFLDEHKDLSKYDRFEFIDDGFSGTNADRPKLCEMMEAVRSGEIAVICVKDFSRFFRDYIEAGNYLECVFPFLGVRFISINDNYDSDDFKGTTGGMEMVMRNIIYASYSKDLSLKVISGKVQMMKQGKFIGSHAPYGYIKNPEDKNQLVIDINSVKVVRMIFDLALEGKGTREIAVTLNAEKILTRGQYFKSKYPNNKKFSKMSDEISWNATRVHDILTNQLYAGDLVSHRKRKVSFSSKKVVRQQPIIVENTHEGIVTKEEFAKAQQAIKKGVKNPKRTYDIFALKGLVRCGNCQYSMGRFERTGNKHIFTCVHSNNGSSKDCEIGRLIDEALLEEVSFKAIKQLIAFAKKDDIKKNKDTFVNVTLKLSELANVIEGYKKSKVRLYEKYAAEIISRDTYFKHKTELDNKLAEAKQEMIELEEKAKRQNSFTSQNALDNACDIFADERKLTYEMAHAFIEVIYIYNEETIEIKMKFKDTFEER